MKLLDREIIVSDLTFVAGFGLEDPLRENVDVSIKKLTDSGVNVRMISGDNLFTATRAAVRANIIAENQRTSEEICMTGKQLMEILEDSPIVTEVGDK